MNQSLQFEFLLFMKTKTKKLAKQKYKTRAYQTKTSYCKGGSTSALNF